MQGLLSLTISLFLSLTSCSSGEPTEQVDLSTIQDGQAVATFAGGCFWCTEAVFERVQGVENVVSGYSGGKEDNPTYRQVSYGMSTHAEAIQIFYDPEVVSYDELLEIFFTVAHDPTQVDRQGPDVGKQYRSAIYFHNEAQKASIDKILAKYVKEEKFSRPIATEIAAYDKFWIAEDYHQDYYELNAGNPYIINVAVPKVKKLKKYYPAKVKARYKNAR